MKRDFARADAIGIGAFYAELSEKVELLGELLTDYNDGRKKSFYCLAANLLPLQALREVMAGIRGHDKVHLLPKERAKIAAALLQQRAEALDIVLLLRKKKKKENRQNKS